MHRTCKNTSVKPDRHCENGSILWRDGKNHQNDVTTCFATASRCVTTVLFLGETDRITKWCDHQLCNSIQVRQYGSLFLARRTESPNDVTTSYATASRCVNTVPFHGETDRITKWCDHQLCNSIQVRQYGSLFLARRTESPNDVTTSYATASRCITTVPFHGETDRITKWCDHQLYATASRCVTTVPFHGETDRITTCRYKILRPVSHPPIVHSFVGTARTSGAVPPALNATLRFLFRGETDRITKRSDHQLCNSIQVRHDGSFFLARRTELPGRSFTSIQMFHTHTLSHTKAFIHRRLHRSLNSVYRCKWNADHPNNAHAKYLYLL